MARISTYQEDASITGDDILLGSSAEGSFNGNTTYVTRNFKLSELAQFFNVYDPDSGSGGSGDLTALTNRVIALENAGYLTEHPNITAASSVDNSGQFFIQDITLDSNGHIISITSAEATGGGGGITNETDPVYSASPAAGISTSNITNWNTAYSWGDHSTQSYLTTETDPTVPSHVKGITVTEVANWNTAYTWGDHSTQGYLTTFTETDPTVASHIKNIASSDITEWNSAYDNSIVSMSVTGTSTKTITLTQQDGGTVTASFTDISETGTGGITDTNDFVTSATLSSGTLTLGIPNQKNVTVSGFSELTSFSATNNTTATGDGSLAYNSNTGEFTYTPADFSGDFLSLNGGTINGDLTVTGIINVNSATGTSNFINDVSIDGDLSVDGTLTVGTITADVRGDVYSIVGATASTKVLESGAGSTPTAYFIGDLTTGAGDANMVFDTSLSMFRNHDVKIGDYNNSLGGGAENLDLYLGATSSIFFGAGIAQKEISATFISDLNFTIFSTITGTSFTNGVLTLRTKGADQNEPGYSNYTENLQTYFDGRYVELAGDQMTGNLSFSTESIGVVGNIFNTNGTKILENGSSTQTAYLVGNVAGDIIQSDLTTVIFDSSENAFTRDVNIGVPGTNGIISDNFDIDLGVTSQIYFGRGISLQEEYVDASKISTWDAQEEVSNMYFYEEGTTDTFRLRLRKQTDSLSRNTSVLIEKGAYMTMSVTDDASDSYTFGSNTIGALNIGLNYAGLESQLDTVYARLSASVSGVTINSGSAITGTLNIEDGTSISAIRDGATNNISLNFVKGTGATGYLQQQDGDARYIQIGGETQTLDDVITNGATTTTTAVIPFYYANQAGFPSASTYHGAIAHSHNDGAMYFAHSGVWNKMANSSDLNNYALASALPTAQEEQNWNNAYNNSITDITLNTVTGGADEGKIVLTQQDLGTLKTTSLDLRYAKLGTHPAVSTSATNTSNTGNTVIQNLTFDSFGHVLSVTSGTVSTLELASGVTPTSGHVATFDANGDILSSSITSILPTTTVFTSGSPDFGSNTITAGNFILSSDRDLKENITPLANREIKADFKEYNFKGSKRTRFGVIAQELEEHHPEFVHTRESGDKSVAYIDLLVAKVHELENRIKELENGARNG